MLKRSITVVVACALLFQVCGCTTMKLIPQNKINDDTFHRHITITTVNGEVINRHKVAIKTDSSTVFLEYKNGKHEEMAVLNVKQIQVAMFSPVKTVLLVTAGITLAKIIINLVDDLLWDSFWWYGG